MKLIATISKICKSENIIYEDLNFKIYKYENCKVTSFNQKDLSLVLECIGKYLKNVTPKVLDEDELTSINDPDSVIPSNNPNLLDGIIYLNKTSLNKKCEDELIVYKFYNNYCLELDCNAEFDIYISHRH